MKERTSLVKNSIYNVIYKLLNVFFPLISSTYVSHVLTATGVGKVTSAQNIAQYFVLIAALGIPNYGTREIARVLDKQDKTNKLFSELFFLNFISTMICSIAYYILIANLQYFSSQISLYAIAGLAIVFNIINVDWYYQGSEEFKFIAIRGCIVKILSLIGLFIFVRSPKDCSVYALIYVLAIAGNYLFNIFNLRKRNVKLVYKKIDIVKHIKPVGILLCTVIAIELYTLLDTTMISYFCEPENVAYYTNSVQIVRILITTVSAIGGVLLPRLSYYRVQGLDSKCGEIVSQIFHIMLFIFLPSGIGLMMTANCIMPVLFGNSFTASVLTLRLASILVYALGFSNLFGTQVLLTFDKEKNLFLCTLVGAVSNIVMNYILIPKFQQNGAVIASIISETLVTVLSLYFARKCIKIKLEKNMILTMIFATVIMAVGIYMVSLVTQGCSLVIELVLEVIIGIVIYIFINKILKNPLLKFCNELIRRKK